MEAFPVIAGPTAGGKSALAMAVAAALAARRQSAEIVSADAFQVYRGMDIGTAKPTAEELAQIPHRCIDLREPTERFSVHEWLGEAESAIAAARERGAMPIVVGGTHLYVKALLDGLFEGPEPDPALRETLRGMDQPTRRAELERVDPEAAERIHPADERRTVRALEVYRQTGTPISEHQKQWESTSSRRSDARLVVIDWPAEGINPRINARVRAMVEAGFIDEVRTLVDTGRLGPQAGEALGYKQIAAALSGVGSLDDAIERTKIETRRFAKNQRTWLRRLAAEGGTLRLDGAALAEGGGLAIGAEQVLRTVESA